jgi:hypothetical protein
MLNVSDNSLSSSRQVGAQTTIAADIETTQVSAGDWYFAGPETSQHPAACSGTVNMPLVNRAAEHEREAGNTF